MYTALELAQAFIETGEITDALDALNTHLTEQPADLAARRLRAELLTRASDPADLRRALSDFDQLPALTPDDIIRQSAIHERLNDPATALATVTDGLRDYPGADRLTERYLVLLQAQGDLTTALAVLDDLPQTWRWSQWRGDLTGQVPDHVAAVAHYSTALTDLAQHLDTMHPDYAQTIEARLRLARAESYRQLDQRTQADADYARAEALVPDDPAIPFNRGLLAALDGRLDEAVRRCRNALEQAASLVAEGMRAELQADPRYAELVKRLSS